VRPPTRQQQRVLALIASGHTNKQIAEALGITENTAKTHVEAMLVRIGANTRSQAVDMGWRQGWLP